MRYIKDANPVLCKDFVDWDIINRRLPLVFDVRLLSWNESAQRFYRTIYPRARLDLEWCGHLATSSESGLIVGLVAMNFAPWVEIQTTPLVLTVQQIALEVAKTSSGEDLALPPSPSPRLERLLSILDILKEAGAEKRGFDNAGLSAYDHARILGLSGSIVVGLRPPNVFDGRTIEMPQQAHHHRRIVSMSEVRDDIELSPVRLGSSQIKPMQPVSTPFRRSISTSGRRG